MALLKNLSYRVKRIFQGENGIVEKVDSIPENEITDRYEYRKDYYKHGPMLVTFRNPLGEFVTELSPLTSENLSDNIGLYNAPVYKNYEIGDKFP